MRSSSGLLLVGGIITTTARQAGGPYQGEPLWQKSFSTPPAASCSGRFRKCWSEIRTNRTGGRAFFAEIEVRFGLAPLYRTINDGLYKQCIPYEGHEDFLGTDRMPENLKPKRELKFGDKVRAWDDWEEDMLSIKRVGIFVGVENGAPYPYRVLDAETKRIVPFQYCEHAS